MKMKYEAKYCDGKWRIFIGKGHLLGHYNIFDTQKEAQIRALEIEKEDLQGRLAVIQHQLGKLGAASGGE